MPASPRPRGWPCRTETFRELGANGVLAEVLHGIGEAAVVKPAQGGSAQGVTIVTDAADLPRAMVDAYTYSDVALIEKKIEGTETPTRTSSGSSARAGT